MTFAPASASAIADALPMPALAPVTSAVLPDNAPPISSTSSYYGL
jgi:hypothetical protein